MAATEFNLFCFRPKCILENQHFVSFTDSSGPKLIIHFSENSEKMKTDGR